MTWLSKLNSQLVSWHHRFSKDNTSHLISWKPDPFNTAFCLACQCGTFFLPMSSCCGMFAWQRMVMARAQLLSQAIFSDALWCLVQVHFLSTHMRCLHFHQQVCQGDNSNAFVNKDEMVCAVYTRQWCLRIKCPCRWTITGSPSPLSCSSLTPAWKTRSSSWGLLSRNSWTTSGEGWSFWSGTGHFVLTKWHWASCT